MRKIIENPFFFFTFILCAVLFSLQDYRNIFVFAVLFVILYGVIPWLSYYGKCAFGVRKIKKICKQNGYLCHRKRVCSGQTLFTITNEKNTFSVLMFSSCRHAVCTATVEDECTLLLSRERAGTMVYASPAGYAMSGTNARRTNVYGPTNRMQKIVKNFPSSQKTSLVTLILPKNDPSIRNVLIIDPPMCEIFCRQKGETELCVSGVCIGAREIHTLASFCEMISIK